MNYKQFLDALEPILDANYAFDRAKGELEVRWRVDGEEGGWYDFDPEKDEMRDIYPDPEPDFEDLDKILEKLCPNITQLQAKALEKDVVEQGEHDVDFEYYGNWSRYAFKKVDLKKLYEYLVEKKLINGKEIKQPEFP
jgi:hypothetical protein